MEDDQEINRDALGVILEDDYEVICAENGKEALSLMREHIADLSVVLLDLMMPVMSGFDVLETVRGDELLRQIPIIVLTAEKTAELKRCSWARRILSPSPSTCMRSSWPGRAGSSS